MNFFEHETKVKYIEGVLSKSQNWDWLIAYIEDRFNVDLSINSFDDFWEVFSEIEDIYRYFNSINQYIETELVINQKWLQIIYDFSLYYIGRKVRSELKLHTDFAKVFELLIYLAKLNNEKNKRQFIIYFDILSLRNLYKLIDVSNFIREENEILERLSRISFNTDEETKIFQSNINKLFYESQSFINKYQTRIVSVNCFSFQRFEGAKCLTWEELYLKDMLCTKYKGGKLTPSIGRSDGSAYPDLNLWTPEIIETMERDFYNESARFVLESVNYALHGEIPSKSVLLKHVNLLNDYYDGVNADGAEPETRDYSCSSLELLISILNDEQVPFNKDITILFNKALKKITDIQKLVEIDSRYPIRDKKLKKTIDEYIIQKLNKASDITSFVDFENYIKDDDIVHKSTKKTFETISDVFENIIVNCEGVHISHVFIEYMKYLLGIKNNRNVKASDVSKEINYLRHLWQDEYYNKCLANMHSLSEPVSISESDIDIHNNNIVFHPYNIAYNCMFLNKEKIINAIDGISKTPFSSLVTSIDINEDFPYVYQLKLDDQHEIDRCFKSLVETINNENSYRFLNHLETDQLLAGIYKRIKYTISFEFGLFRNKELLYKEVIKQNTAYHLIEYSENPNLAQLTQLFPILENKVREIGEFFSITPIREDKEQFNKHKEPTSVLKRIITEIYDETESLEQVADFLFVFFTMFAENGLNIRNNCVHGVSYNKDPGKINYAFKLTLFCLHLLDYRYKRIVGDD